MLSPGFCMSVDFFEPCLQVLAEENLREIVEFSKQEGLVLLADEVGESN